ncbi:MAG: HPr family phosphocarrier protein [Proteobacteria bacterium]|nr:HPr family phosphocarrier protein [Pseudomonadota bacterium]
MKISTEELTKTIVIINELGLHARPAAMIAKLAQKAESNIWIIKEGTKVDAASIIDILSLACVKGTEITLQTENFNDINIVNGIVDLIENGAGD